MKTYSIIVEVKEPFIPSGNLSFLVATAQNGKLYRFLTYKERHYAVLKTYGTALRGIAEKELLELGGDFITETGSKYWPDHSEIINQLKV